MIQEPKALQWILCDLGKTLVDFDHSLIGFKLLNLIKEQNPDSTASIHTLQHWFFQPDSSNRVRNLDMDRGFIDVNELSKEFAESFQVNISPAEFDAIWSQIFSTVHQNVMQAMRNAQTHGIKVAICSSTNAAHWNNVCQNFPEIEALTPQRFLTYEMGLSKTDADFFPTILRVTKAPAEAHLFIDDLQLNLDAASNHGIQTLLYHDTLPDWKIFQPR